MENFVYSYVDNSIFEPVDKFQRVLDLELSVLP